MNYKQRRAWLLLLAVVLITLYYFLPLYYRTYSLETTMYNLKKKFNEDLEKGRLDHVAARYLKMLINNYESVQNKAIFNTTDADSLRECAEPLIVGHIPRWHQNTPYFNLSVLGPTLIPILSHPFKGILKRQ